MQTFHNEILTKAQQEVLSLLRRFSSDFYLVGGTAISLYLGHRESIDFDLFTTTPIEHAELRSRIPEEFEYELLFQRTSELTAFVNRVKFTFYKYPYEMPHKSWFEDIITIPTLLDLAAMKALALGGRSKWKDYVDLYFITKKSYTVVDIIKRAEKLFGSSFNAKLFREQLCYFDDIDYSEKIRYISLEPRDEDIKKTLTEIALTKI